MKERNRLHAGVRLEFDPPAGQGHVDLGCARSAGDEPKGIGGRVKERLGPFGRGCGDTLLIEVEHSAVVRVREIPKMFERAGQAEVAGQAFVGEVAEAPDLLDSLLERLQDFMRLVAQAKFHLESQGAQQRTDIIVEEPGDPMEPSRSRFIKITDQFVQGRRTRSGGHRKVNSETFPPIYATTFTGDARLLRHFHARFRASTFRAAAATCSATRPYLCIKPSGVPDSA